MSWSFLLLFTFQDTHDSNLIVSVVYYYCYNENENYWIATIYIYKGLMLAFGVFLAWETRIIALDEIKDSKNIAACIYNVVIFCIFGVPVAHFLTMEQTTLKFVFESLAIFTCTTACQCIIFIPKVSFRFTSLLHTQHIIYVTRYDKK